MAIRADVHVNEQFIKLLKPLIITTAISATATTPVTNLGGMKVLTVQVDFTYGSSGTSTDCYIQTSLDGGTTWMDVMEFNFTTATAHKVNTVTVVPPTVVNSPPITPTDGTLASNTAVQGFLGDRIRLKYVTVGIYAGSTTLDVYATIKG